MRMMAEVEQQSEHGSHYKGAGVEDYYQYAYSFDFEAWFQEGCPQIGISLEDKEAAYQAARGFVGAWLEATYDDKGWDVSKWGGHEPYSQACNEYRRLDSLYPGLAVEMVGEMRQRHKIAEVQWKADNPQTHLDIDQ